MNETQLIKIINSLIERIVHKFVFGFYDLDDIKQEAFIIAIDGLERYEEGRPLENFLAVHISNRLKTFKRDNYFRPEPKCIRAYCDKSHLCNQCLEKEQKVNIKKNIMDPIDIYSVDNENEKSMSMPDNLFYDLTRCEIQSLIEKNMPLDLKIDYEKMLDGKNLPIIKKQKIEEIILDILDKYQENLTYEE